MPSITSWIRLEPRSRTAEMETSLQARIYDPLWLLARQWQMGEFQGQDNGSPILASWRAEAARISQYHPGPLQPGDQPTSSPSYDVSQMPLEALVEQEAIRPAFAQTTKPEKLRLAAEAGQTFLRMLGLEPLTKNYNKLFTSKFPFPPLTAEQRSALDPGSLSYLEIVGARVPDGRGLFIALRPPAGDGEPVALVKLPAKLGIAPADQPKVLKAAERWVGWCETFFDEPGEGGSAWSGERLEYSFSVGTRLSDGEHILTAPEYSEGHLDWYAFDVNPGKTLGAAADDILEIHQTGIPAPISFRGMPAMRFWEFEDAQVDFGAIDAGPADLARMLLVEFVLNYSNDWFVLPIELEVGTLSRTQSFVITDTFGVRKLILPANSPGIPALGWRMFQLAQTKDSQDSQPAANLFFLPPALLKSLESSPIEEVLFLRDEMANLAWGVERLVESASEGPLNRFEMYQEKERRTQGETPPQPVTPSEILRYLLSSEIPDYWVPLMPVKTEDGLRLRRGAVLKTDGELEIVRAKGRILESGQELSLFEEEVPREGVRVRRSYQFTRWTDGSSHLWIGRRKGVGRGEGSSGLQFDSLNEKK